MIAGCDEAGKGCVLGDLVLSITLIKNQDKIKSLGLKDSKLLSSKKREELDIKIRKLCKVYSYSITAKELNELMCHYSLNEIEAMKIAYLINQIYEDGCTIKTLYVDSPDTIANRFTKRIKKYLTTEKDKIEKKMKKMKIVSEHKADENYPIVSAASIISKVKRDAEIERIKKEVNYDFNSGYTSDKITIQFLEKRYDDPKVEKYIRKRWKTYERIKESAKQNKLGDF